MRLFPALLTILMAASAFGNPESEILAHRAHRAESAGQFTEAYLLYSRASALDPANKSYRRKVSSLSAKAVSHALEPSAALPDSQEDLTPAQVFDSPAPATTFQPPPQLEPRPGRFDINLNGDYKSLFEQIAAIYQLQCVFDSDFQPGRRIPFVLGQADYRDALNAVSAATGSFVAPLSGKVFVVAKDTPQKRNDLEQSMTVTVPVPQYISVQELVEIAQAVRQAAGVEKLSWDNKTGSVIMRDRISRVRPALEIFHDLFGFRPEVVVDLQLIQLTRSDIVNYGINLPNLFNIVFTGQSTSSSSNGSLPADTANPFPYGSLSYVFTALASQGGSSVAQSIVRHMFPTSLSLFSISIGAANALVNFSDSQGKTVLKERLRSVDGQPATFHYGQKYPIVTASYASSTTVSSQYTPTSSFKFEDLGVSLKITPRIHGMDSVSLDVESDFKLLTGASVNGDPIISNRTLKSSVTLENDAWAVVAGLQQSTDTKSLTGTDGLSSVPLISELFSQHMKEKDRSEILILMRPHLLSLPGNQSVPKEVWVGTDSHPHTPL